MIRTSLPHTWREAVNVGERQSDVDILLMHYTGMKSGPAAVNWLCVKESKVSCHYLVDVDGSITQMVSEDKRASHAGRSYWQGVKDINSCSIGIEIQNEGPLADFPDYPDVQIAAVIALSKDILSRHNIAPERVIGHSDVAPGRKIDPGPKFPWQELAKAGVGVYPHPERKDHVENIVTDFTDWVGRAPVEKMIMDGRFVRLEPLDADKHGAQLFECSTMSDADDRFTYLSEVTMSDENEFRLWAEGAQASVDPLYYAVIDKSTGKVAGRQTFLRTVAEHGVTEIGHIFWSALIAKTPATTEAYYLFAKYVFDDLKYRRFEWKCNDENEPSKRAALRYGCQAEGVHRNALVVKGKNRDTAWFSMLDREWPLCKAAFEAWLAPENFDGEDRQIERLEDIRKRLSRG